MQSLSVSGGEARKMKSIVNKQFRTAFRISDGILKPLQDTQEDDQ
jgi:hypothetical protein